MSGTSPVLEIAGLRKRFGELHAIDGVDLTLSEGGVTAVIGPNGAGKTTLFNLVTRRLTADAGTVRFLGTDITTSSPDEIVRLGLVRSFQISSVFADLSVRQNVLIAVLARLGRSGVMLSRASAEDEAHERTQAVLERLSLTDRANVVCAELGYGDRRRVELGMVLALEPRMVLLDEPTAGMGPAERRATGALIGELASDGRYTVVLTEHDVDLVFGLARRVVVMHQGQVIADAAPDEIAADPEVRRAYLGGVA